MLTPLEHHSLLLFWLGLLVLFAVARGLGLLAQRIGQPAVVGELAAGLVIGPSLFGRIAPDAAAWLFPGDELHSGVLLAIAWVGVILLLVETGFETDLGLLRRIGRSTALVPIGSLFIPLAMGVGLGFLLPDTFLSEDGGRTIFALFIGVCLAVSSLPVVAKILIELNLMRRNVGQVIIVAGMADDIVGWVMLSTLAGAVGAGGFSAPRLGLTVLAIVGFVVVAFTIGQRATNTLLRRALRDGRGGPLTLTAVMLVVLVFAVVTQAIGIEAVFGAFVAGIVISRSRYFSPELEHAVHTFTHGLFAPVFFATAGMYVDLGQLADPTIAAWAVIVFLVASAAKLIGSYAGARLGPLNHREAIAVGVGLNARGALEVIIATIALSLGVFNQATYTVIVLLAMSTSMIAPPLLRWSLGRTETTGEEAERLDRERTLEESVIAKASNALLPTRGGANSAMAARVLDLVLRDEAHVTVFTADEPHEPGDRARRERIEIVTRSLGERELERRSQRTDDAAAAIVDEARLRYDLLALGVNEDFRGTQQLSPQLQRLLVDSPAPLLLVRRGRDLDPTSGFGHVRFRRILVPVPGTRVGRAAEEVAYTIGNRTGTVVDVVHVVSRNDAQQVGAASAIGQLSRARTLAERFGGGAAPVLRVGATAYEEIVATADERGADLIVLGTQVRTSEGAPFLGHGTEYVLQHASQTVLVVVFPADEATLPAAA